MRRINLFTLLLAVILMASCVSKEERLEKIETLSSSLFDSIGVIQQPVVQELIENYLQFVKKYPKEPKAPGFLVRAAELAMHTNKGQDAISYLDRCIQEYPEYEKLPECYFLKAYIYENTLLDIDKARQAYTEFLEKFPESDFADDAQSAINNLGRPLEDIIREFEAAGQDTLG